MAEKRVFVSIVAGCLLLACADPGSDPRLGGMAARTAGSTVEFTLADGETAEGDDGETTDMVLGVIIDAAITSDLTFDIDTSDDSAEAGTDYEAVSDTITLPAGDTLVLFTIPVYGDDDVEDNERFFVDASNIAATGYSITIVDDAGSGTILNDDCEASVVDFEDFAAGEVPGSASCISDAGGLTDTCVVFDSANPTGGDVDLGTPHEDFGGPGEGVGGESEAEGQNDEALDMVLVIAESDDDADGDGLIDEPDDEATGGEITWTFDDPITVDYVRLLDIDSNEGGGTVTATTSDGSTSSFDVDALGDNSVQTVAIGLDDVASITVALISSGALAEIGTCSFSDSGS